MVEYLFKSAELFKGKDRGKLFKLIIGVIFVTNISYWLLCVFYPEAPNLTKGEEVSWSKYWLQGEYIIPLGFFVIVWSLTSFLGTLFFQILNLLITEKLRKWILKKSFLEVAIPSDSDEQKSQILTMANDAKGNWIVHLYNRINATIPKEKRNTLKLRLKLLQDEYEADFVLMVRASIGIFISYHWVSYFGSVMLCCLFILILIETILLFFAYQFAAIIPIISYKLRTEMEEDRRNLES